MSREDITTPSPGMEICPENSRYAIRWDAQGRKFLIGMPGSKEILSELGYEEGHYIYAVLRGQQRIEEMAKPSRAFPRGAVTKDSFFESMTKNPVPLTNAELEKMWQAMQQQAGMQIPRGGKYPVVTHRHAYASGEAFVHTEDARKRSGMDITPRKLNRDEDCHAASIAFIEFSGLAPVSIDLFESIMSYEDLRDAVEEHPLPILIKIQASDPKVENGRMIAAHSCIIVGKTNTDFICFEKVGVAYPWRLAPLTEIHQMYEHDFVTANEHRPQMQWEITALARRGGHAER